MKEILNALNAGDTVLIETEQLPDFWKYCMAQEDYYSFRYAYFEKMVKITLTGKETILRVKI